MPAAAPEPRPDALSPWQERTLGVPEAFDLFLGGGRGPGKTHCLAALFLRHCEQHASNAHCLVARKSFPGLEQLEAEFAAYFGAVYGLALKHDTQRHRFTLPNGATIRLDQLERESDFQKLQGRSYSYIAVDEAGQYASPNLIDRLRSSLRAPQGTPTRFMLLANPGGPGHHWLVRRHALERSWLPYTCPATGAEFVTVHATYRDNPFIDREKYRRNLIAACATDPELAKAWLDGDWSVLRGAYFSNVIDESRNLIEPWARLPDWAGWWGEGDWRFYLAHDFGVAAPSVTYLCAESRGAQGPDGYFYSAGSVVLVDEDAQVHPDDDSQGLGLTVPDQAHRIKGMTRRWGVPAEGVADDAIFNRTGSQRGSIADEFRRAGVIFSRAGKGSRIAGWQTMRRMLADAGKPDLPGLYVSRLCRYWWATVPSLPRCPRNPEDVDTNGIDHAADCARYALRDDPPVILTQIRMAK